MKVILLRDVAKIGKRFEIVEVPNGFALNKLIPAKDAEPASPANVKRVLERKKKGDSLTADEVALIRSIHDECAVSPLVIDMEANEQGHLFQSVHVSDIIAAAAKRGMKLPEAFVRVDAPIKSVGVHEVRMEASGTSYSLGLAVQAKSK